MVMPRATMPMCGGGRHRGRAGERLVVGFLTLLAAVGHWLAPLPRVWRVFLGWEYADLA